MTPAEIKAWREARHLDQLQFSQALGVPLGTIRDWEQGRSRTHDNLLVLALAELSRRIASPSTPFPPEAD